MTAMTKKKNLPQLAKMHGDLIRAIDKHSVTTLVDNALYMYIPEKKLAKIANDLLDKVKGLGV